MLLCSTQVKALSEKHIHLEQVSLVDPWLVGSSMHLLLLLLHVQLLLQCQRHELWRGHELAKAQCCRRGHVLAVLQMMLLLLHVQLLLAHARCGMCLQSCMGQQVCGGVGGASMHVPLF